MLYSAGNTAAKERFLEAGPSMSFASQSALAGRRVLIAEDEYYLADDVRRLLVEHGAEILGPLPTVRESVRAVAEVAGIDCAVLDINLRGEDVFAVAQMLRQRGIPFVLATGYGEAHIPDEYRSAPRLEKPFEPAALLNAVIAITR
jgi:CheY-like chemotaxis protein